MNSYEFIIYQIGLYAGLIIVTIRHHAMETGDVTLTLLCMQTLSKKKQRENYFPP
jgi:hypothetical protein